MPQNFHFHFLLLKVTSSVCCFIPAVWKGSGPSGPAVYIPRMAPVPRRPETQQVERKHRAGRKGGVFIACHARLLSFLCLLALVGALNETEAAFCCLSKGRQEPQKGPEGSKGIFLQR